MTTGTILGPYEILTPLGQGGMGEVWKARDNRLDRIVAVKVSKAAFTDRFEREARAVAALNHPHICTLYDVGPNYLVMEFVEGSILKGPLPVEKAVEYAGQTRRPRFEVTCGPSLFFARVIPQAQPHRQVDSQSPHGLFTRPTGATTSR